MHFILELSYILNIKKKPLISKIEKDSF